MLFHKRECEGNSLILPSSMSCTKIDVRRREKQTISFLVPTLRSFELRIVAENFLRGVNTYHSLHDMKTTLP